VNREDLQALADLRAVDAKVLLDGARFSAAYYLLGYAVESALKACVAKQIKQHDFPDKRLVLDSYTHDLQQLLRISGVNEVNWTTVKDWNEGARYDSNVPEVGSGPPKRSYRRNKWCSNMVEDSMVKESLTDAMIRAGADLTKKLDALQWPVVASLWFYASEGSQWKLVLASPRVTSDGPTRSYEAIQDALAKTPVTEGALALSDIEVTDPKSPLITLLRKNISTGPTVAGMRFTRNVVNGHFIEDAYIYRMSDRAPTGQVA